MNKIIQYDKEAQESVKRGIDTVANIVKTTIGPKGRNILIRNELSQPIITNDGVTIAKSVELHNTAEDAGAQLIISAANKTNEIAGDGTTTTTILAQSMIHQYYNLLEKSSENTINPVQIQKEMLITADLINDYLLEKSVKLVDNEDIEKVASISSGDKNIGKLIADAFIQSGEYGSVIVEDSKTGKDNLTAIQGMKLSNGIVSPYLLNDRINLKSDMFDVDILVTKDKLDNATELFPVLDYIIKNNKKLLIICDDIDFEPLNMIIMNKAKGASLNVAIIRLPGFAELRENLLEDICLATGARLMGRDLGLTLRDFSPNYLGEAEQVIVTLDDTVIKFSDYKSDSTNLFAIREQRANELKTLLLNAPKDQQEQYKRRISNLVSGISIIQVGGNSEVEIKDKKLRIEDAINSVQAAKEEGIVPGGGYSFIEAFMKFSEEKQKSGGYLVVLSSILDVAAQIATNSGVNGTEIVEECIKQGKGYNALTNTFEDLISAGVINAVKVDRYSLLNAVSVASTVITMGGLIVNEPEKDQNILQLQTGTSLF